MKLLKNTPVRGRVFFFILAIIYFLILKQQTYNVVVIIILYKLQLKSLSQKYIICIPFFSPENVDHAWNYKLAFNWRVPCLLHCTQRGKQLVPNSEETIVASAISRLPLCVDLSVRWNGVIV